MYDVIVAGGGVSGSVAAIASARNGARTLLVERYGFLGGSLTNAGVGPMMTFHAGKEQVVKGIPGEIVERLQAMGGSPGHIGDTIGYASSVTPFDAESLKLLLDEMTLESGCDLLLHTMVAGAAVQGGRITAITVCNKAGLSELAAQVFIDATGDADLARWAGVDCQKGRDADGLAQPMTMNLKIGGVDRDAVKAYMKAHPGEFLIGDPADLDRAPRLSVSGFYSLLGEAIAGRRITFERDFVLFFETNTLGEVILNMTRVLKLDATRPEDLTRAELEGRKQARQAFLFLKQSVPGFQNAVCLGTPAQIGIRESRRITGTYRLTDQDLLAGRRFEDAIARGGYPIDIHNPSGNSTDSVHLPYGASYQIPYRSLLNDRIVNLAVAGRCLSATHEAAAAIRVSPIAMAIGQAAGTAAALGIKTGQDLHRIDVAQLQKTLLEQSAVL
jgi:hypothetical protein